MSVWCVRGELDRAAARAGGRARDRAGRAPVGLCAAVCALVSYCLTLPRAGTW